MQFFRRTILGTLVVLALPLGGCVFTSRDGPFTGEVRGNADVSLPDPGYRLSYAFVELSPSTADYFAAIPQQFATFSRVSIRPGMKEVRIGLGDSIAVSVFEAGGGGLFLPESSRAASVGIPPQQVDASGTISVPYAGTVRALGRTTKDVQREIEERLKARAIEPQVIVSVSERRSNYITVLGEVNGSTRFPAEPSGIRLLSALARAGGSKNPPFESIVTVQRQGRTEQALLTAVVTHPSQDIMLFPGDVVFVSREPRSFLAFGATVSSAVGLVGSNNRRYVFEQDNLSLADGLAKAGGLESLRADPSAVFLYRQVPKTLLARAGVDVSKFREPLVPTIFQVDLSKAEGYFLAHSFYIQNRDVIYISESPSTDLTKFLAVIQGLSSTVSGVASTVSVVR